MNGQRFLLAGSHQSSTMNARYFLVLIAVLSLTFLTIGCDTLVGNLIQMAIPYDLNITAPDTVHASSLPCRVDFSISLEQLCLPITYTPIRVGNDYFYTDCNGEARCYQTFNDYGSNQIKVEALDSIYIVIADAERPIVIVQER